jgi:hypothetical protein
MRHKLLLVPVLAALPVFAGDVELGVLLDKQYSKAQTSTFIGGTPYNYDSFSPTGLGVRVGFDVLDLKVAALQLNGTWHNKSTSDLKMNGTKQGEFDNQYWAAGAMVNWKLLVNVGAGVEYRSEKLAWRGYYPALLPFNTETTQGRPWARVNVGFSIPTPIVSPFFLLEVAAPLSKNSSTSTGKDFTEALAPQVQIGIYGGIRF